MSHFVHGIEWFEARGEVWRGWRFEHLWKKHRCPHRFVTMKAEVGVTYYEMARCFLWCMDCRRQLGPAQRVATGVKVNFGQPGSNERALRRPVPPSSVYCEHGTPLGCICSQCPDCFAVRGQP